MSSKYTKTICLELSNKCSGRSEFRKKYSQAYKISRDNGWLYDFFGEPLIKRYYWNYDTCKEKAKNCNTIQEFFEKHHQGYKISLKNGWLKEFFPKKFEGEDRDIKYEYELNYEYCKKLASNYKSYSSFRNDKRAIASFCKKMGWLEDFFVIKQSKPKGYWTYERCKKLSEECKNRADLENHNSTAYKIGLVNGWLDDFFLEKKKPKSYWTYERCKEVSCECKTRSEFSDKYPTAYKVSLENEWLNEFFGRSLKPLKEYWTYDTFKKEAQKCASKNEFRELSRTGYAVAKENGWLEEFFGKGETWTFDECKELATKCSSRSEFKSKFGGAANAAYRNGWMDEILPDFLQTPPGYWNYKRCEEESKKYESRYDFWKNSIGAYYASMKNGWIDKFMWLEDKRLDFYGNIDSVYVYEFTEFKTAYVGRTLMVLQRRRDMQHICDIERDAVAKFAKKHNIPVPEVKILEENLTIREGVEKEGFYIEKYHNDGWTMLNKAKAGSIGALGKGKWNYENCKKLADKCNNKTELRKMNASAYNAARNKGWLDEFFTK